VAIKLYQRVAAEFTKLISVGSLRAGDRLPSIRELAQSRSLSPTTVLHSYEILVANGWIEARPRSGYYVARRRKPSAILHDAKSPESGSDGATRVEVSDLVFTILEASRSRDVIPLGSAFPSPVQFPWSRLARFLGSSARHIDPWSTVASLPPGSLDLRRQIARRYLRRGTTVDVEEIVVTAGALEALSLSLQSVARAGDTIAIESPAFYGCLQAVERLRLNVVEIPTDPFTGIDLEALAKALTTRPIKACWLMTTLHHPTGATAAPEKKREIVRLLAAHDVPLIEDDAYGDLQFTPTIASKAFDKKGLVLHCGSFSKCLAPGYRLGWVAAGRYTQEVARRKIEASLATSLPIQQCIAQMLQRGGYESHLAGLRRGLAQQQAAAMDAIQRYFPAGMRVSRPAGGYFLWIECPAAVDSLELHRMALESGISIAPGPMFSARRQFWNCLRLNYGHPWTAVMDRAIRRLGEILKRF